MVVMPTRLKNILSKPRLVIPTLIVAIGIVVGVVVVAVRSDKPALAAPRPLDVEVIRVEQKDVPVYSEWIGTTEGIVNADISGSYRLSTQAGLQRGVIRKEGAVAV